MQLCMESSHITLHEHSLDMISYLLLVTADIARNHSMGCTALRLSLEWHRIEPQRGQIDREAIAHYHKILDVLEKW